MNACRRVDDLLSAYVEEEASPAEVRFVEGHLTVCSRCRSGVEDFKRILLRLPNLPRVETGDEFTDRVLLRVRGSAPAGLDEPLLHEVRVRPAWVVPLAAAAALAVAVIGAATVAERMGPGPDAVRTEDLSAEVLTPSLPTPTPGELPEVTRLTDIHPGLADSDPSIDASLGMTRDAYVLEDWVLREPTGGGSAILTRVGADPSVPVTVTF